jgi:hypothetical protein
MDDASSGMKLKPFSHTPTKEQANEEQVSNTGNIGRTEPSLSQARPKTKWELPRSRQNQRRENRSAQNKTQN